MMSLTCSIFFALPTMGQEVPETTSACALQKAATLSLATARVEEHVAQHATVAPTMAEDSTDMLGLLLLLGLVAFRPQVARPIISSIRSWLFTFRSLGEANGLPASQRFCQDVHSSEKLGAVNRLHSASFTPSRRTKKFG